MRCIKYTYVDAVTGVPVSQSPALNGPRAPDVTELTFEFALESEYPTANPTMYGSCPDDADISLPGVITEVTEQELLADKQFEMAARAEKTLRLAVEQATFRINQAYEERVSVLAAGYTPFERESWPLQAIEAKIVLGADDEPTAWIDASAAREGVTRRDLALRIQNMDAAYRVIHGELSAIRRLKRDEIEVTSNGPEAVELLSQVQWPESQPTE